ncbi:MAG: glycosyltransferase family 2 protein, partial [Chloroflexia bacterium]|nr:glycosyltransferase family 2 protein [Chloroflexia bacterium]
TNTRGKSWAQNLGLSLIASEFVLLTDDDCEVPPNWVDEMLKPFKLYPRVGVVFCDVLPAPHDSTAGFVPDSISPPSTQ